MLWPVHNGVLRYCGFDVLPPAVTYMPGKMSADERRAALEKYRDRLLNIENTPRLFFHSAEDYGPDERLKPGVIAGSGVQRNP
jgi:NAD(P)H dehydrogenase (quinone)